MVHLIPGAPVVIQIPEDNPRLTVTVKVPTAREAARFNETIRGAHEGAALPLDAYERAAAIVVTEPKPETIADVLSWHELELLITAIVRKAMFGESDAKKSESP